MAQASVFYPSTSTLLPERRLNYQIRCQHGQAFQRSLQPTRENLEHRGPQRKHRRDSDSNYNASIRNIIPGPHLYRSRSRPSSRRQARGLPEDLTRPVARLTRCRRCLPSRRCRIRTLLRPWRLHNHLTRYKLLVHRPIALRQEGVPHLKLLPIANVPTTRSSGIEPSRGSKLLLLPAKAKPNKRRAA
jgi:hypothetical protein